MNIPIPKETFLDFLVNAKRSTYAASNNNTRINPSLSGSIQLEFRKGALFYRDIYFGGVFFVGQETVYLNDFPIWGMSYAGGVEENINTHKCPLIYSFLQEALRQVSQKAPYRGPEIYNAGIYSYTNRFLGKPSRFTGVEQVSESGHLMYQLHYSGGELKE